MHVKPAIALLLSGLPAAFSFMIVPEIAPADDALFSILPVDVAADAESQTLDLPCAGCPILLEGKLSTLTENHLELTFRIDHAAGFDRLLVNSFELYPNADPFSGSLAAPQIVDVPMKDRRGMMHHHHHHVDEEAAPEVPLGYRIDVYPVAKDEANQKLELINVDLQVIEVGQTFVGSIPTVSLKLVKDGDSLAIAKIETGERTEAPAQPKCTDLWCSVKEMLNKGLGMFKKPCPGMMKHGHHHGAEQPKPTETVPGMPEDADHVDVPGHRHPHHHHGHHGVKEAHGHHRFFGALGGVIHHVILPVLVGIVAGISVSLVGMVVISSLLCLVRFIRGKKATGTGCPFHRRMCRNKAADTEIVIVEEEKSGLMVNQDPPPKYEEDAAPRS